MARKQPKPVHQLTSAQFEAMFPDEDACRAYLVARRWPKGIHCPRCKSSHVYALRTMAYKWECMECGEGISYRFSHLAGTIFENTNKPLRDWFKVAHLMLTSKRGMSALQIFRYMGFGSYKTAWGMCHKIRVALMQDIDQLGGIGEVTKRSSADSRRVSTRISAAKVAELVASVLAKRPSLVRSNARVM
jgi:transposase-like protein